MRKISLLVLSVVVLTAGSAVAVNPFTETFDSNASNWLNGASTAPTYNSSGGIDDSGYISYTSTFTSGASGPFGAPPLQILFRGNNSADASNDALVGNWLAANILSLSVAVRHDYTSTLGFYARIDAGSGQAASVYDETFSIAPNTWTTITIPITESNPPFLSYGAGSYTTVFSNVQNLQLGLYVPASTTFTNLRMDIDNVKIVPEPGTFGLGALGVTTLLLRRRRKLNA